MPPRYSTVLSASIPSLSLDLDVKSGTVTLDATHVPYVEARLTIPLPAESVMEQLDPRDDLRVVIEASVEWVEPASAPQTRTFDLVFHDRVIDHEAQRVTLRCVSDEALLIDGALLATAADAGLRLEPTVTLRDEVIPTVFGLAGLSATLEAGAADADVTGYRELVNLAINPSAENATATVGFAHSTGASGLTRASGVTQPFGSYSARWTAAAGDSAIRVSNDGAGGYIPCKPGYRYAFVYSIRSSIARNTYPRIRFYSEPGSGLQEDWDNAPVMTDTVSWIRPDHTALAPEWARFIAPIVMTTGNSSGQNHWIDGVILVELPPEPDEYAWWFWNYFDGDTNAYPSLFTESWDGAADASTSRLTPLVDRDLAALDIVPGVSWWDYLTPLIRSNDLRLWCDETRDWWLTEPLPTVAGTVTIAEGANAIGGQDVISFQETDEAGRPLYYTGVVVRYHWTDELAIPRERFDVAGTSRKVLTLDVAGSWPGSGRAAALLEVAAGRGRTQEIQAVMDLAATPGMALTTDLPSTPEQIGVVAAVTWTWTEDTDDHGTMTVRARDLEEA